MGVGTGDKHGSRCFTGVNDALLLGLGIGHAEVPASESSASCTLTRVHALCVHQASIKSCKPPVMLGGTDCMSEADYKGCGKVEFRKGPW